LDVAGAHFSWALDISGAQFGLDFEQLGLDGLGMLGFGQRVKDPFLYFSFLLSFWPSPSLFLAQPISLSSLHPCLFSLHPGYFFFFSFLAADQPVVFLISFFSSYFFSVSSSSFPCWSPSFFCLSSFHLSSSQPVQLLP
jgi:hypothetical protein